MVGAATGARPFRVSVLGLYSIGKTSLCRRFNNEAFVPAEKPTVVIDFFTSEVVAHERAVRLQVYDTAGQERFAETINMMLRDLDGALVVYALDSAASYERAKTYVERLRAYAPALPVVLVGNKLDLIAGDGAHCVDTASARATDLALETRTTPPPSPRNLDFDRTRVTLEPLPRAFNASPFNEASESDSDDSDVVSLDSLDLCVVGAVGAPAEARNQWGVTRRRAVPRDEARRYARAQRIGYVETSALANTNVVGAFRLLAEHIVRPASSHVHARMHPAHAPIQIVAAPPMEAPATERACAC